MIKEGGGEFNPNNPDYMTEQKSYTEKIQTERERFDLRMQEEAKKIGKKMGITDDVFLERLKNDLIRDYADVEYDRRNRRKEKNPNASTEIFETGEDSELVEDLIVEKVLSGLDPLTGINNRASLDQEVERRKKEKTGAFSMIMIDIDKFKSINDTYGHDAGDYVLTQIAQNLKKTMREGDFIARYGGEELIVLAPNANGNAVGFAERLRKTVEESEFIYKKPSITEPGKTEPTKITITISLGVSPFKGSFEVMQKIADLGLYEAKKAGRNQVQYLDENDDGEYVKYVNKE